MVLSNAIFSETGYAVATAAAVDIFGIRIVIYKIIYRRSSGDGLRAPFFPYRNPSGRPPLRRRRRLRLRPVCAKTFIDARPRPREYHVRRNVPCAARPFRSPLPQLLTHKSPSAATSRSKYTISSRLL